MYIYTRARFVSMYREYHLSLFAEYTHAHGVYIDAPSNSSNLNNINFPLFVIRTVLMFIHASRERERESNVRLARSLSEFSSSVSSTRTHMRDHSARSFDIKCFAPRASRSRSPVNYFYGVLNARTHAVYS